MTSEDVTPEAPPRQLSTLPSSVSLADDGGMV